MLPWLSRGDANALCRARRVWRMRPCALGMIVAVPVGPAGGAGVRVACGDRAARPPAVSTGDRGARSIDSGNECADDPRFGQYFSQNKRLIFPYSEIFLIQESSQRLVLQGQLDTAAREGPGHAGDRSISGVASPQVVDGCVPVAPGPADHQHAGLILQWLPGGDPECAIAGRI